MDEYRPPSLGEAAADIPPTWAMKLANKIHLEWCAKESDWRELGHTHNDANPTLQIDLEEQEYPTIG